MELRQKFNKLQEELMEVTVERVEEIHGLLVAVLGNLNILFLGSPGIAKSYIASRFIKHLTGGMFFQRMLTAFSTPEELFGPFSMKALQEDRYLRITKGMLPESHISFIDEVFKSNAGILNSLLEIMNEREFSNGLVRNKIPLLSLIGCSNEIPEDDEGLGAMYDRFHLKYKTDSIQEPGNFMKMIELPDILPEPRTILSLEEIKKARLEISKVTIPDNIIQKLTKLRGRLDHEGLFVTDRTYKISMKVLRVETWLKGRTIVEEDDMDILRHMFWADPDKRRVVYLKILEMVNPEKNQVIEKFDEVMKITREIFAEEDAKKQMERGIEAATKFKKVKTQIQKLIKEMEKKGKDIEDVNRMLKEIDVQIRKIFVDACNIDLEGGVPNA